MGSRLDDFTKINNCTNIEDDYRDEVMREIATKRFDPGALGVNGVIAVQIRTLIEEEHSM